MRLWSFLSGSRSSSGKKWKNLGGWIRESLPRKRAAGKASVSAWIPEATKQLLADQAKAENKKLSEAIGEILERAVHAEKATEIERTDGEQGRV